ncbi:MAG: hypothetical protein ABI877_07490 [Gemmatimonadaceae bacterium]
MSAALMLRSRFIGVLVSVVCLGCAQRGPVLVDAVPAGEPASQPPVSSGAPPATRSTVRDVVWRVYAREHVDLWLHGFAMLQGDSTLVPYFRPDYRVRMERIRRDRSLTTALDASHDRLASYLAANPRLISAQFIPLYFDTWEDLRQGFDLFLRANGNPRYGRDQAAANVIATFEASFPQSSDREWARSFVQALDDERARFYREYWLAETRVREGARSAFEQMWRDKYRAQLRPFFTNAQQDDGEVVLSLTLGGEGRTVTTGRRENFIAVPYPESEAQAHEPLYVFLHEIAGPPATTAVHDQTTPAEQRDGTSDRYASLAAVRGGAIILQRIAPELVTGYQRYYLGIARVRVGDSDPSAAFERTFPLPEQVRAAVARQIDIILGGI